MGISARYLQLPVIKNALAYRLSSDLRETPTPLIRFLRLCKTFGFHCMFAVALQRCISIGTNSLGALFGWHWIYRSILKLLKLQASVCVETTT